VDSVSQRPNLRHLCEPLGETSGLLETEGFKKTTECVWCRASPDARWEWVPDWRASYAESL